MHLEEIASWRGSQTTYVAQLCLQHHRAYSLPASQLKGCQDAQQIPTTPDHRLSRLLQHEAAPSLTCWLDQAYQYTNGQCFVPTLSPPSLPPSLTHNKLYRDTSWGQARHCAHRAWPAPGLEQQVLGDQDDEHEDDGRHEQHYAQDHAAVFLVLLRAHQLLHALLYVRGHLHVCGC